MSEGDKYKAEVSDEGRNKNAIRCVHCNSLILNPSVGTFCERKYSLPLTHQKNKVDLHALEKENYSAFWQVKDMYHFENIGFLNDLDNVKYLICADCERGPVGYHDTESKENFVALERVKHEAK